MNLFFKKSAFCFLFLLSACQNALQSDGSIYDPLEGINRVTYNFNDKLDSYLLKPVAKGYDAITPYFIQNRVSAFFGNLDDIKSFANSALQLKGEQSMRILARVINNTIFGLGGLFDVATPMNNPKIETDFGATLAHYGVQSGAYLVLPVLGPSTLRDGAGRLVDGSFIHPTSQVNPFAARIGLMAGEGIQKRAELLGKEDLLQDSPDPYTTMRDAWLQHRAGQLGEGVSVEDLLDQAESQE